MISQNRSTFYFVLKSKTILFLTNYFVVTLPGNHLCCLKIYNGRPLDVVWTSQKELLIKWLVSGLSGFFVIRIAETMFFIVRNEKYSFGLSCRYNCIRNTGCLEPCCMHQQIKYNMLGEVRNYSTIVCEESINKTMKHPLPSDYVAEISLRQ